ncbi:sugar ABC transporter permease [Sinorhizobium sp. CB9]
MTHSPFRSPWLAAALLAPMMLLVAVFFYWPVAEAFYWSFFLEQPFGGGSTYVGLENFRRVLSDPQFWKSLRLTLLFMILGSTPAVVVPLALAVAADRSLRASRLARNVLVWPKGVAGASIGVVFAFIFNPFVGILTPVNGAFPGSWNPGISGTDAFIMLIVANVWSGIPFNFVILLSGLQSLPDSYAKAAAMDGAGPWRQVFDIRLPLIAPQIFFTFVLEFTESVVSAFGLVDTMTQGGPGGATTLLVYKIYTDGFKGYDLSGASTQTALLMVFVALMATMQFLLVERHVKYER